MWTKQQITAKTLSLHLQQSSPSVASPSLSLFASVLLPHSHIDQGSLTTAPLSSIFRVGGHQHFRLLDLRRRSFAVLCWRGSPAYDLWQRLAVVCFRPAIGLAVAAVSSAGQLGRLACSVLVAATRFAAVCWPPFDWPRTPCRA